MIAIIFMGIGFLLFMTGCMKIITDYKNKIAKLISLIGAVIIVVSLWYSLVEVEKGDVKLLQNIAIELNVQTTSNIIIEDISEDKLFSPSKNKNLRKVYYNDEIFIVEVENYEIKSINKVND